ncbi:MAG TPA: hypothetical protein VF395_21980 [Polyangiaceae bacterium]
MGRSSRAFRVSGAALKRCGGFVFLLIGCGSSDKNLSPNRSSGPDGSPAAAGQSGGAGGSGGKSAATGGGAGAGGAVQAGGTASSSVVADGGPDASGSSGAGGGPGTGGAHPGNGDPDGGGSTDAGAGGRPLTKEGGAPDPNPTGTDCPHTRVMIGTKGLAATGPTSAFATAYGDAISMTAAGPFVVDLTSDPSSIEDSSRGAFVSAAAATLSGGIVETSQTSEMYYDRSSDDSFHLGPLFTVPFHLTLGTTSVLVQGLELSGQIDATCTFVPGASGTIYVSESQASVALGGSTLGALLGPKNYDVTGGAGAKNGWAIPLSGDAAAVRLP